MRVTIIKDDNTVTVNGEAHTVDLSALPADFHALQWDGARGEVEYVPHYVDDVMHKKPNETIKDLAPYQPYLDAWTMAKAEADAKKAAAEAERMKLNAPRSEG